MLREICGLGPHSVEWLDLNYFHCEQFEQNKTALGSTTQRSTIPEKNEIKQSNQCIHIIFPSF